VLCLELPLQTVDVNVHPAKIEVRFVNERPIFDAVYHGVKSALENRSVRKEAVLPDPRQRVQDRPVAEQLYMTFSPSSSGADTSRPAAHPAAKPAVPPRPAMPSGETPRVLRDNPDEGFSAFRSYPSVDIEVTGETPSAPVQTKPVPAPAPVPAPTEPTESELPPALTTQSPEQGAVTLVGEAFATYVIAEMDGDLYLIDKHAAHERILYNRLKETAHNESQQLLAPVSVSLSAEEQTALLSAEADLKAAGFEIEPFGGHEVLVRAVPLLLSDESVDDVVREVAGGLAEGKREVTTDRLEWLYHNTACRAAIKAGNRNQPGDLLGLAEQVLHDDTLRTCPHGRPVCIRLTRREIEKQFGRLT
ncbi:MAG: DNA mismatch repair protein MutL, partial [Clostridia bacterium]|nr:DNA mismatch repair protein MutL [Clostridia bacterium]